MNLRHRLILTLVASTRRNNAVVVRGRVFERDELDTLLARVRSLPDVRANDWMR